MALPPSLPLSSPATAGFAGPISLSLSPIQSPFFPAAFLRIPRGQHPESELPPNLDHFLAANFKIGPRYCTRKAFSTMQLWRSPIINTNRIQNDFSFAVVTFISVDQQGHNSPANSHLWPPSLSLILVFLLLTEQGKQVCPSRFFC